MVRSPFNSDEIDSLASRLTAAIPDDNTTAEENFGDLPDGELIEILQNAHRLMLRLGRVDGN